jgi:putative DNA primase/helicase
MYTHNNEQSTTAAAIIEEAPAGTEPVYVATEHTTAERKPILQHDSILSSLLTELKPIDFYEKAGLSDGENITKRHCIVISIEQILAIAKQNLWSLCMSDGFVYCFNGAYWKQITKGELLHFLGQGAEKLGVDAYDARFYMFRESLLKQFMATAYLPKPQRRADEVLINLQNGTYVITPQSQFLRDFERSDFMTYQLPFIYSPEATAPLFQRYLDRVLPDTKQQQILSEFIAYVFIRQKTLKLEKSLILYGGGANGKSVFFDIITALLGSENVSNFSLQSLTNESGYQRAKLTNKLLNYASEISPNMDSTLFKQLVSREPVEARLPYGEPFVLEDYAKLLFNTNELPRDVEQNEAFFRRFIILHFNVTIPEGERDPELANKIIAAELAGVFNWVLEGLKLLLEQKKFTYSAAIDNLVQQYRQQSDSVQLFLMDAGYVKSTQGQVALKEIYYNYKQYCTESGYRACSLKVCSERLRNQGYELVRKKHGFMVGAEKKTFF